MEIVDCGGTSKGSAYFFVVDGDVQEGTCGVVGIVEPTSQLLAHRSIK